MDKANIPGMRTVKLRTGIVLGSEGGALKKLFPIFKLGTGGPVGNGRQWMSWIHVDDMVALYVFAATKTSAKEGLNGTAPNPVTNADFAKALGKALHRPAVIPAPAIVLKLALGEMSAIMLEGARVLPKRTTEAGFKFRFENLDGALADICKKKSLAHFRELYRTQWIPLPVSEVFPFFSNEQNLEEITPPWLNFRVVGKSTDQMETGTLIYYRLRLHGFPLKWRSRIESWRPNEMFVDRQVSGPYQLWHHTHRFTADRGGTLIEDRVLYRAPWDFLVGRWVRKELDKIFDFRYKKIGDMFRVEGKANPARRV